MSYAQKHKEKKEKRDSPDTIPKHVFPSTNVFSADEGGLLLEASKQRRLLMFGMVSLAALQCHNLKIFICV